MAPFDIKNFDHPDELIEFDHGTVREVSIGPLLVGHTVFDPGWRWSTHVKPLAGTELCDFRHVGYMISGCLRFVTVEGEAELVAGDVYEIPAGHDAWVVGDQPVVNIDFQGLLGWGRPAAPGDRILTTLLFTDLVASTALAERLGDAPWKRLLAAHRDDVRNLLDRHRGVEVDTAGDGFLVRFDSPGSAVRCASEVVRSAGRLGLEVRTGIHTGEVELSGSDVRGVAVHLAARIMGAAGPGEILVSATTRELVAGAGHDFEERGTFVLKGISGPRTLFALQLLSGE
jgi:class 3 adenylate cyclase